MVSFLHVTKENLKEHCPNWSKIPDYTFRKLIIGGSGSRKIN